MIKDFLILNFIGKNDKIGLRVKNNFFIHEFIHKVNKNDQLAPNILNLLKKHKVILDNKFSIIVNNGPGSFSSIRTSFSVAKGMKLSKNINLYAFNNSDLEQFNLENIELLIAKGLLQNKLIKPIYLS
jgi:tRNA A37 threonylcarbamoyladenosine modification protein TsaB|tara:strand:- start:518 stop:901 length:384 start_codon:yes stop_codon:yes gene_type:complete